MYAAIVKALVNTNGPDISGNEVEMPAGSYHLVSKHDIKYYRAHPDVFEIVREADQDVPALLATDASGALISDPTEANPYGYALIPRDEFGYAVANFIPRRNTLSALLTNIAGGVGEISEATDCDALVLHNGVVGGAKTLHYRRRYGVAFSTGQTLGTSGTAAALSFTAGAGINDSAVWAAANPTRFYVPTGANYCRVTARLLFAANATGYRYLDVVDHQGVSLGAIAKVPAHPTLETEVNIVSQTLPLTTAIYLEIKAMQDSGGSLAISGFPMPTVEVEFWRQ